MEGDTSETPWGEVPRRERSMLKRKARVHDDGQGNVAEETTETTTTPEWVVKLMEDFQGYDANQIMELKEVKATDLDKNQGRLSLPKHVDRNFLNIGELGTLAEVPKKGVNCFFIDTKGKVHAVELRDWANGLVLAKRWRKVIEEELYTIGQKYPLWCFRSRNDKLCFTLVKPDQVDPIEVLPNVDDKDAKRSDTEEEEVANKNEAESSSFNHTADGHSSLPGHVLVMNASKDCDVPSGAECNDLAVNEPESGSFQDVLPSVNNKDAKLSDTEEEEVANKNEAESSLAGHDHPPESPAGVSSLPGEDMDLSYLDGDGYLPTEAEVDSFHLFP
ncbi:hypothetical protein F2Q68_00027795 [Brassica cretica]|uniref:TF-B3 domain-containing protein n=1 Tax=Brassica cretica TaxID=69181 RepID=A0A8S9IHG8_BRACR|nr:hypothetical protein F2Q68_00027795 [Brassica cretica]